MTTLIYLVLYAGGIVFLAGAIVRAIGYARQPIHLRWEIYPVPQGHGGELKVMIPEILFLKGLWEFNRSLWCLSYPFHGGLYLVIAGGALAALNLTSLAGAVGVAGLALVLAGSLGLLIRRLTTRTLRIYTAGGDILNLVWFAATAVLLLAGWVTLPPGTPGPIAILRGALSFDNGVAVSPLLAAGFISGAALIAYIPMTHMSHFVAKYFTYHAVRWDERAAGCVASRMAEYLTYRPTWSAPHIEANGERSWAEIATSAPKGGGK